jgi:GrpB-like predicted nucleotidyltransferase (UPF0157 family)
MWVEIAEYDEAWPSIYARERSIIGQALGDVALSIEHVGSTSVPHLAAKPLIDIVVAVPSADDEAAYVPALERAGYRFVLRESDWFGHRLLRREPRVVNLHVFSDGCAEIDQMTGFRDWLRTRPDDMALYAQTKHRLAEREWVTVQDYADAKSAVVTDIKRRAGLCD